MILVVLAFAVSVEAQDRAGAPPKSLACPVEDGPFLLPAEGKDAEPIWGIKGGIAVGLWPNPVHAGSSGSIRPTSASLASRR